MTVTAEEANSGSNSVKIESTGGFSRAFLTLDLTKTPALEKEIFGSMWIFIADENTGGGDFTFLQAEGYTPQEDSGAPAGTTVMYRGRIDQRYDHVTTNYETLYDPEMTGESAWVNDCSRQPRNVNTGMHLPAYVIPKNEWACVQWHIKQSNNHIDFTVNQIPLEEIRIYGQGQGCSAGSEQDGHWYAPERFERLHLGVTHHSEDALPRTVYIDDITVDTRLVECDGSLRDPSHH